MTMNKYELALVINAKIEDDARTDPAEIERRVRIMEPVMRYLCVKQDA